MIELNCTYFYPIPIPSRSDLPLTITLHASYSYQVCSFLLNGICDHVFQLSHFVAAIGECTVRIFVFDPELRCLRDSILACLLCKGFAEVL